MTSKSGVFGEMATAVLCAVYQLALISKETLFLVFHNNVCDSRIAKHKRDARPAKMVHIEVRCVIQECMHVSRLSILYSRMRGDKL